MQLITRIFKDKAKSRVFLQAVTSYSQDHDIVHGSKSFKVHLLILSIGSAVVKLAYHTEEDRDQDVIALDDYFKVAVE